MVTMKDLAQEIGVSVSTVSLVLNERDQGRVRRETAERVRRRAAELGYAPNLLARGLKTQKSHTIGLVADRVATVPFAGQMLAGAQNTAWEENFLLMVIDTAGRREMDEPAAQSLLQRDVEGLIVAADFHREVVVPATPERVPAVVLDGWPSVAGAADGIVPNETAGAQAATQHLLAAGHRRISLIDVSGDTYVASRMRREGYQAAHRRGGLRPDPSLLVDAPGASTLDAVPTARELLTRPDRPSAVFCFSDQIAMAVIQVAMIEGLRVPDDLSVVGFDNQQFIAEALIPGLTTVQLPHYAMGEWAAHRAISRIRGEVSGPPAIEQAECALVTRDSVAAPNVASDRSR